MVAELPQGNPLLADGVIFYRPPDGGEALAASKLFRPERLVRLPQHEAQLLVGCNGQCNVSQLAEKHSRGADQVRVLLARWHQRVPGLLRWCAANEASASARARRRAREAAVLEMWAEGQAACTPATDNIRYHREDIDDADEQFEHVETTVSHLFRERHSALGGRRYGEAFCDAVIDHCALTSGASVLEIGGGTGLFALAFLDRLKARRPDLYAVVHYTLLDLSPELQRAQRQRCAVHAQRMRFVVADVEKLTRPGDLSSAPFDLIIANEMVGDLRADSVCCAHVASGAASTEAERLALRHQLDFSGAPSVAMLNGWRSAVGGV